MGESLCARGAQQQTGQDEASQGKSVNAVYGGLRHGDDYNRPVAAAQDWRPATRRAGQAPLAGGGGGAGGGGAGRTNLARPSTYPDSA